MSQNKRLNPFRKKYCKNKHKSYRTLWTNKVFLLELKISMKLLNLFQNSKEMVRVWLFYVLYYKYLKPLNYLKKIKSLLFTLEYIKNMNAKIILRYFYKWFTEINERAV